MQYDRPHYYLSLGGTAVGQQEIWQTGLRFAPVPGIDQDELVNNMPTIDLGDVFEAFRPIIENTDSIFSYVNTLYMEWVKLAPIGVNGKYCGSPSIFEGVAVGKNTVTITSSPQIAWVCTLGTGKKFGMAQKGRMYWPTPHGVSQSGGSMTGQLDAALCSTMRNQVLTAIKAAEGEISTVAVPSFPAVMSSSGGVSAPQAAGSTNPITEISFGSVLDVQRRRRNNLIEQYVPVEVPPNDAARIEFESKRRRRRESRPAPSGQ